MSNDVITVAGLSKSFDGKSVLESLNLDLGAETVYGLVGLNGVGKTTLIRLLLGLLRADSGHIDICGHDPWNHSPQFYRQVGAVLEHDGFRGNLTFDQNLKFFARARGISDDTVAQYLETEWSNWELVGSKKRVKFFSRGQRMQCALCRAFLGWPKVCFLDEPTVALDMEAYDHFCRLVQRAKEHGSAIVISSHHLEAIEALCDRIGILQDHHLSELANETGSLGQWALTTDNRPEYGEIIRRITGSGVSYTDGKWHFNSKNQKKDIPLLVAELVAHGCPVYEVRPVERAFRETIKKAYIKP
ncbi:MAG: ATP-binding cassette domain-containing protein [Chitinivibrionales bacterium]|nr:ATP-binding cassette domain-containing protein [Chitinivibrionales bacterium]